MKYTKAWMTNNKKYADDVSGVTCAAARSGSRKLNDDDDGNEDDDLLHSATPPSATFVRDASGHSEMVFDVELPASNMGRGRGT